MRESAIPWTRRRSRLLSLTVLLIALSPLALGMTFSAAGRFALAVIAALVVYTPGYAPDLAKFAFVGFVCLATVAALFRLQKLDLALGSGLKVSAALYAGGLAFAGLTGWTDDLTSTLQQGLPYALLLLMLPVAIDAGLGTSPRVIEAGIVLAGLVSAASFTVFWLDNRNVSALSANALLAASVLMPALLFQWGLLTATDRLRSRAVRFIAVACSFSIPIAFFLTGTRTALVLGLGFAAFLIWSLSKRNIFGTVLVSGLSLILALPALAWLAAFFLSDATFIERRIGTLQQLFSAGANSDRSWQARQLAFDAARTVLQGHWITGLGLSAPKPLWLESFDTSLSIVMRLGVVGTLFLITYVVSTLRWAIRIAPTGEAGDSLRGIVIGWSLTFGGYAIVVSPVQDPLFAFTFSAIIALAVSTRQAVSQQSYSRTVVVDTPVSRGGRQVETCRVVDLGPS